MRNVTIIWKKTLSRKRPARHLERTLLGDTTKIEGFVKNHSNLIFIRQYWIEISLSPVITMDFETASSKDLYVQKKSVQKKSVLFVPPKMHRTEREIFGAQDFGDYM